MALETISTFVVPFLVPYLQLYSPKLFSFLEERSHVVMDAFSTIIATLWGSEMM